MMLENLLKLGLKKSAKIILPILIGISTPAIIASAKQESEEYRGFAKQSQEILTKISSPDITYELCDGLEDPLITSCDVLETKNKDYAYMLLASYDPARLNVVIEYDRTNNKATRIIPIYRKDGQNYGENAPGVGFFTVENSGRIDFVRELEDYENKNF